MAPSPTSQIVSALSAVNQAALGPGVAKAAGAGKAYQSVAQSTAIAVQDATDYLRNVATISSVAYGMAMVLTVAGQDETAKSLIENANTIVTNSAKQFKTIGLDAAAILRAFPSS